MVDRLEPGDPCPRCHPDFIEIVAVKYDCACHLYPPCGGCEAGLVYCPVCGWESDE